MHHNLQQAFVKLGRFNSKHSGSVVGGTLVLWLICSTGALRMKELEEKRIEKLWTPDDSITLQHKEVMENMFEANPDYGRLILSKIDGSSILDVAGLRALASLEKRVFEVKVGADDFESLCARFYKGGGCRSFSALQYFDRNQTTMENALADSTFLDTINGKDRGADGTPIIQKYILGGVKNSSKLPVASCAALMSHFYLTVPEKPPKKWRIGGDPPSISELWQTVSKIIHKQS